MPNLQGAIEGYIWQRQRRRYHFGPRDVRAIADSTGETAEEVERAFFGLAGDVWTGEILHRGHGAANTLAYFPMAPPPNWLHVAFDVEWMQERGTLPLRR